MSKVGGQGLGVSVTYPGTVDEARSNKNKSRTICVRKPLHHGLKVELDSAFCN